MNWLDLPSLTSLRAFAALAESGSLSQAGRTLNVSHAAISQQTRALEERLGTSLFTREGRGIALTPAGAELARALASAFAEIEAAISALTGSDRARPLQVSVTPTFATSWLLPRLADFQERHPEVELMINPTPAVVQLTPGGVDVAIRYGLGNWPGLEVEPLVATDVVVVAPPELVAGREVGAPALLADLPWMQEAGTNEVTAWLARWGITPDRKVRITHLPGNLMLDALRRGERAVAAVSRAFVETELAEGRLMVLFEQHEPGAGYHIVTRRGVHRPPLRAFLSWLRGTREAR